MICLNYHEIFILVNLTYINYLIWTLFLLFSGECFQKMICFFGLSVLYHQNIFIYTTVKSYIYITLVSLEYSFLFILFLETFFFTQVQSPGLWSSFVCWSLGFIAIVITEILACKKNNLYFHVHIHHTLTSLFSVMYKCL